MNRLALLALAALAAVPAGAVRYRFELVGGRNPFLNQGLTITDGGLVGGDSQGPYVWSPATGFRSIGPRVSAEFTGFCSGLNDDGVAVGQAHMPTPWGPQYAQAFYYTPTTGMRRPPSPRGRGTLLAVNGSGLAVGEHSYQGNNVAVAYDPILGLTEMGRLDPTGSSVAWDVNRHGVACGGSTVRRAFGELWYTRPFVWTRESGMVELPTFDGILAARAYGINDLGEVAGHLQWPSGVEQFVFVKSPGQQARILGPGWGYKINDRGQVVGSYYNDSRLVAMLYEPGVGQVDLNLVTEGLPKGWRLFQANDINQQGDIVAEVEPPGSVALVAILRRLD